MKIKLTALFILHWLTLFCLPAQALEQYHFEISEGNVVVQPAFCPPDSCTDQSGDLTGDFIAEIADERLSFVSQNISSSLDGFTFPSNLYAARPGATADATLAFDGDTLVIEGFIDERAYDGPLTEYRLTAVVTEIVDAPFDPFDYYEARPDFRKCASPMCGGIFVKRLNHIWTHCPDGSFDRECYIGDVNWDAIGGYPFEQLDRGPVVLQGQIGKSDNPFQDLGLFTAENAWQGIGTRGSFGRYFAVINNGIVCITSPCFSFDLYTLNSKKTRAISSIDLERSGASEKEINEAYRLMGEGQPVLSKGYLRRVREFAGTGIELKATRLFLPINKPVITPDCSLGYSGRDCSTEHGCVFPQIELQSVGGAAMIDPETGEAVASISYSCVDRCEVPGILTSPGHCALYLP